MRGGGALARRSAGLGTGGAALRGGSAFSLATIGAGAGCGSGFGKATIDGIGGGSSIGSGSCSACFGFREDATVLVK